MFSAVPECDWMWSNLLNSLTNGTVNLSRSDGDAFLSDAAAAAFNRTRFFSFSNAEGLIYQCLNAARGGKMGCLSLASCVAKTLSWWYIDGPFPLICLPVKKLFAKIFWVPLIWATTTHYWQKWAAWSLKRNPLNFQSSKNANSSQYQDIKSYLVKVESFFLLWKLP